MNVILRIYNTVKSFSPKSVSMSMNEPEYVIIESADPIWLMDELSDFDPVLVGKLVKVKAKSISIFE